MKIAYRAFITILIAFAFGMTVIGFVKHIPLVFFLSLACIFVALAFYIFKSAHYKCNIYALERRLRMARMDNTLKDTQIADLLLDLRSAKLSNKEDK